MLTIGLLASATLCLAEQRSCITGGCYAQGPSWGPLKQALEWHSWKHAKYRRCIRSDHKEPYSLVGSSGADVGVTFHLVHTTEGSWAC